MAKYSITQQLWHARYREILGAEEGDKQFNAAFTIGLEYPFAASEVYSTYERYLLTGKAGLGQEGLRDFATTALGHNASLEWILTHPHAELLIAQYKRSCAH